MCYTPNSHYLIYNFHDPNAYAYISPSHHLIFTLAFMSFIHRIIFISISLIIDSQAWILINLSLKDEVQGFYMTVLPRVSSGPFIIIMGLQGDINEGLLLQDKCDEIDSMTIHSWLSSRESLPNLRETQDLCFIASYESF